MTPLNYHRARKDSTHHEIAAAFERAGFSVLDLSPLKNACDLVATNGIKTYFVECKSRYGKLTPGEERFHKNFKGRIFILRSEKDVYDMLDMERM